METLDDEALDRVIDRLSNGGQRFTHLPFVRLRRITHHRCGTLTLWPKHKTLHLSSWDDLRWRPLGSYAGHRWKKLFNIGARWTNFALEEIGAGFHVSDPSKVLLLINSFNDNLREAGIATPGMLVSETGDISDFFSHVSREEVLEAVAWFSTMLARKFPGKSYF